MTFDEALHAVFKFEQKFDRDTLPILALNKTSKRNRRGIAQLAGHMQLKHGVEIGTAGGMSAIMWCEENPLLNLTCIDPYMPYKGRPGPNRNEAIYKQAQAALEPYGKITLLRETSMEAVQKFEDGSLDFLHIDGDHTFDKIVVDIVRWVPKVRKGGLISLHDYCPCWNSGVVKAVDAYMDCHRISPWFVTREYASTAFWEKGAEKIPCQNLPKT